MDNATTYPSPQGSRDPDEENAAAILLTLSEETKSTSGSWYMDEEVVAHSSGFPDGSAPPASETATMLSMGTRTAIVKDALADTSVAANALLKQYLHRKHREHQEASR